MWVQTVFEWIQYPHHTHHGYRSHYQQNAFISARHISVFIFQVLNQCLFIVASL
jgi:hypothetical protein